MRSGCANAVSSAYLVNVARTSEIAVGIVDLDRGLGVATPALPQVLCTRKGVTLVRARLDTLFVFIVIRRVDLGVELASRLILLVAAGIAVSRGTVGIQRRRLLADGVAPEFDNLLAKRRVTEIHGPLRSADVCVHVDLTLWHRAEKSSVGALTGCEVDAFAQVDLVPSANDTRHAKRRLGHGD